ncbi:MULTISPECIES: hypothetical protein [unclassified Dinoroseobacter]|uniref:hypothetical protein n=1 Tax=unclassified Dinoroseobacter TaxID=2620028 RepID=UPI003C7ECFAA
MESAFETTAKLQASLATRALTNSRNAAQLAAKPPTADTMAESWELAEATYKRMNALQQSWIKDWSDWISYAQSLDGVDTMPKYVDRTGNIFLQAQAQMVSQASELSELMDNVGVSYAYWISGKLHETR